MNSAASSRYLERSNDVLDYIDCISNEEVPFGILSVTGNASDTDIQNTRLAEATQQNSNKASDYNQGR